MPDKPLIMIVEDEVDLADNIVKIIRDSGKYEAIAAYSAKDALKQISKYKNFRSGNHIKLILLDIKMPEMDGLQFLTKLRLEYPPETMGVIILTAWEDHDKYEKARKGFAAGYLMKPFGSDQLLSDIDRFFAGKGKWMIEQTKWETLSKEEELPGEEKGKE